MKDSQSVEPFQLILFLDTFEDLGFCPDALMGLFAEKVASNPDSLTLKDLRCILKVYSSLNYDLRQHREQYVVCFSHFQRGRVYRKSKFVALIKATFPGTAV